MKLSTYRLDKNNKELIGVLKDDSVVNLNQFYGEISMIDLFKKKNWKSDVTNFIGRDNVLLHATTHYLFQ